MRRGALAPFRVRSFRFQWTADLLASWAFEMETLILGWYILVETGSVLLLAVFAALQYLGTIIAPLLGVAGDRVGHRNVLFAMRAAFMVSAATLMTLAFAHALTPVYVLIIVALNGLLRPSDHGVRTALVAHIMQSEQLIGALAVARSTVDSARIAGALAGAGLFVALGMGPAYVVITCFYAGGSLFTLGVTGPRVVREGTSASAVPSLWQDLKEGIAYVWATPGLHATMWIALLVNATAYPITNGLLPHVAKNVYGTDETGLGYLTASFAAGALVGSIFLMLAGSRVRLARVMIISSATWYVMLFAFAHASGLRAGTASLVLAGFMQSLSMVSLSAILMRAADPRFRGRVMGVRMLGIYGLPLGLLFAGALVGRIGFEATATLFTVTGFVLTLVIALRWRTDVWNPSGP
jgi:MFS family permease